MISNVDIKAVENLLGQWLKERHHVMAVLAVDRGWPAKVCEIMGAKVPQEAVAQFGPGLGSYRPRLGIGRGVSRGLGEGRGIGPGRGRGRGGGRG